MGLFDFFKKRKNAETEKPFTQEKPVEPIHYTVMNETSPSSEPATPVQAVHQYEQNKSEPKIDEISEEYIKLPDGNDVKSIEARIKESSPSCGDLYPHEILILHYAPKFFCDAENAFQGFWLYQYGIRDVQAILDSLYERGYIVRGSVFDTLENTVLTEIKNTLKRFGLKVSGKKADLIQRLRDNVPEAELDALYPLHSYALYENGKSLLEKYGWVPYIHLHKMYDIDIWNFTEKAKASAYANWRDQLWEIFSQQSMEYIEKRELNYYRCCRLNMAMFVKEEGRKYAAFRLLCEVCAYDLCASTDGFTNEYIKNNLSHFFKYEDSNVVIAPFVIFEIKKIAEEMNWNESQCRDNIINELRKLSFPFQLFTAEESADIIMNELGGKENELKEIYLGAEEHFLQKYGYPANRQ